MKICKKTESGYNWYNDQTLKRLNDIVSTFHRFNVLSFMLWRMTDPIQQTNPQQQWQQQSYTDDILGGEDIFATIPEAEEDLPYGDMLEKKYQFEPIPEIEEMPVQQPAPTPTPAPAPTPAAPAPTQKVAPAPVQETATVPQSQIVEQVAAEEIQDINKQSSLEQAKVENLLDTKLQTDVQKKFGELYFNVKKVYELKEKLWIGGEETFDILGADNDKVFISYRFLLDETNEPMIFITKIEQDKETEEETVNELRFTFNEETASMEVMVNDTLLFDEIKDFTEDQKKKMQVSEKLNKFIFLASEEVRKMEKEIHAKEEEERERKRLQDIFRNF